jgi:hypothetical protein
MKKNIIIGVLALLSISVLTFAFIQKKRADTVATQVIELNKANELVYQQALKAKEEAEQMRVKAENSAKMAEVNAELAR